VAVVPAAAPVLVAATTGEAVASAAEPVLVAVTAGDAVAAEGSVASGEDVDGASVADWPGDCVAAAGPQAEISKAITSRTPSKIVFFILFLSFRSIGVKFTKVFNGEKFTGALGIFPNYQNSKIGLNCFYPRLILKTKRGRSPHAGDRPYTLNQQIVSQEQRCLHLLHVDGSPG
jgi:hypothetical protein